MAASYVDMIVAGSKEVNYERNRIALVIGALVTPISKIAEEEAWIGSEETLCVWTETKDDQWVHYGWFLHAREGKVCLKRWQDKKFEHTVYSNKRNNSMRDVLTTYPRLETFVCAMLNNFESLHTVTAALWEAADRAKAREGSPE